MRESAEDLTAGDLLYEEADGFGVATLNRPQARNALTFSMYERLADICRNVPDDGSISAIIVRGAGAKAFASGTDISLFRDFTSGDDGIAYEARTEESLSAIEHCRVPTIAAINGACTGGGAMIAAVCDIRIASKDLKFGFPIARTLGNCLSARNLARLSALVGMARTKDMIFSSRLLGSDEALATGLISECPGGGGGDTDGGDAVLARAKEIATNMTTLAPLTLRATKELLISLREGGMDDKGWIAQCYGSSDFHEGIDAFLAKRPPAWQGK